MNYSLQEQISSCKETDSLEPKMVEISAKQALISLRLTVLSYRWHVYNCSLKINNMKQPEKCRGKVVKKTTVIHGF